MSCIINAVHNKLEYKADILDRALRLGLALKTYRYICLVDNWRKNGHIVGG